MRGASASVTLEAMLSHRYRRCVPHAVLSLALAVGLSQFSDWIVHAQDGAAYSRSTIKNYDDVVDDLLFAISEQNYRVTARSDVGSAISERLDKPFPRSVVVHFCNLGEARRFLEQAPDFIVHMPCRIAVYESSKGVVVATSLLPADPRIQARIDSVNTMLRHIVDEAAR